MIQSKERAVARGNKKLAFRANNEGMDPKESSASDFPGVYCHSRLKCTPIHTKHMASPQILPVPPQESPQWEIDIHFGSKRIKTAVIEDNKAAGMHIV